MKKILLITLLITTYTNAQHNFTIKENKVVWQYVFECNNSNIDSLLTNQLQQQLETNTLHLRNHKISGNTSWSNTNFNKAHRFAKFPIKYYTVIETKNNKYRVTITDVVFNGPEVYMYGVKEKYIYKLNLMAIENNAFKTNKKTPETLNELNSYFLNKFTLKETTNNW